MITGKLNLLNLHAIKKMVPGKTGDVECLIIPIEKNKLFVGEKGVYLDIIAFELKEQKEGRKDTHLIKQSFNKEIREAMTEDQKNNIPILGSLTVSTGQEEREPVSSTETLGTEDDLPF
jgi:hypothetical protein